MNRIERIRMEEKRYHDHCYEQYQLFEEGSWLHKPVRTVMELFAELDELESADVLDLGCGVGRNSIPLAQRLLHRSGRIVCVDLLDSALSRLQDNAQQYGVEELIVPVKADVGDLAIAHAEYDYIVSVSCLEHVSSEEVFAGLLARMIQGTKPNGIHCFIISTHVRETDVQSGESLEVLYEINFRTDDLLELLKQHYSGWTVLRQTVKPYELDIDRNGRQIRLQGDVVTWAVRNKALQPAPPAIPPEA
jgi:tellurite methyltransferase